MEKIECIYCFRTFSNKGGKATHEPYCKLNVNRVQKKNSPNAHAKKGSVSWAKGLTKETDQRIHARPDLHGKRFGFSLTGHTEESKAKLSKIAKENGYGGYRRGSGRGKKGWYKGFFCDSSWELAYIIYCLENNISISRNTQKYQYKWQGKIRNFIPDFIVNGKLTEIKGYKSPQWDAKMKSTPDITVLYDADMTPIMHYVIDKYGKDYIRLYEGR